MTWTLYDSQTGEELRAMNCEEVMRYKGELSSMTGEQQAVGHVDGATYGYGGRSVYAIES